MKYINITVMIKDGGYQVIQILPDMLGKLAESIKNNGFEWAVLQSGPIPVVGFIVAGKQVGERLIMLGKDGESQ